MGGVARAVLLQRRASDLVALARLLWAGHVERYLAQVVDELAALHGLARVQAIHQVEQAAHEGARAPVAAPAVHVDHFATLRACAVGSVADDGVTQEFRAVRERGKWWVDDGLWWGIGVTP